MGRIQHARRGVLRWPSDPAGEASHRTRRWWEDPRVNLLYMRESHMVTCEACRLSWDEWDSSITLQEAIERIRREPAAIEDLLFRPCPRCGHRIEWDAAIVSDSERGTLPPSRQRRLAGTLRRLLREQASPQEMEETIRERYGVVAFYVRQEPGDD
jgi:hypothetical protein